MEITLVSESEIQEEKSSRILRTRQIDNPQKKISITSPALEIEVEKLVNSPTQRDDTISTMEDTTTSPKRPKKMKIGKTTGTQKDRASSSTRDNTTQKGKI
jgi:hypothetical protein